MSDTKKDDTPPASLPGSMTAGMAAVVVIGWGVKARWGIEIPADVGVAMGLLLTGAAHMVQGAWLTWRHQ